MSPSRDPFHRFRVDLDPSRVEVAAAHLREIVEDVAGRLGEGWAQARHMKLRVAWRGHPIGPLLPLHVLLVGEGAAVAAMGPLLTALANMGARLMLDVDIVHDADLRIAEARTASSSGDPARAEALLREALDARPEDPGALVALGVLLREAGRADEGLAALRRAAMGTPGHPDVIRAAELLARIEAPAPR